MKHASRVVVGIVAACVVILGCSIAFVRFGLHHQRYLCAHASGQAAIEACTKAIAGGGSGLSSAYFNRASAYQSLHQNEKALSDLDALIRLNPRNLWAHIARGGVLLSLHRFDAAASDFEAVIRLTQGNVGDFTWMAHIGRAEARLSLHQYEKAASDYDAVIYGNSSSSAFNVYWAYAGRGNVNVALNRYKEALDDYNTAARLDDGNAVNRFDHGFLLNNRCWVRAIMGGELDAARSDCDRAVALMPSSPTVYGSRAFVELRQGDYSAAITDNDEAISITHGKTADVLYVRGMAELRVGKKQAAADDFAAAEKIDPQIASRYGSWGVKP